MKKIKIYISGAIAHLDIDERKKVFGDTAKWLELKGFEAVNPFNNPLADDDDWHEHMRYDIGSLLDCDGVYMLKGWEQSKGCKLELDVASSCGIPVYFEGQENGGMQP